MKLVQRSPLTTNSCKFSIICEVAYNVVENSHLILSPPQITLILSLHQMIYDVHPCTHNKCWVASDIKLLEQLLLQLSIHFAQCDTLVFQFSCCPLKVWHKLQEKGKISLNKLSKDKKKKK